MKKVVVGMSGGVDSSVAAILLKNQGYDVIGLFMRNWDSTLNGDFLGNPDLNNNICPQEQDYNDAKKVCQKLNIPLHRVDFIKEYWDYVFTYFLEELKKGRTPNPDVMCNKYIKFDLFKKEAKKLGADFIATGHYARVKDRTLYRGLDDNKDQSYFLSLLTKDQLTDVLFPVGQLTKPEVRKIAHQYNLITADKKDSTGICFIGERNFKQFLENYLPAQPGIIQDIDSKETVGEHYGLMYYTIGQRRGLHLGGNKKKYYVVGKNLEENILYVALTDQNHYLYSNKAIIEEVNWNAPKELTTCTIKHRYRSQDLDATIKWLDDTTLEVSYTEAKAVTPGQICVFYDKDRCLGGGTIASVYQNDQKLWYL